jgi:hypothetical protein
MLKSLFFKVLDSDYLIVFRWFYGGKIAATMYDHVVNAS